MFVFICHLVIEISVRFSAIMRIQIESESNLKHSYESFFQHQRQSKNSKKMHLKRNNSTVTMNINHVNNNRHQHLRAVIMHAQSAQHTTYQQINNENCLHDGNIFRYGSFWPVVNASQTHKTLNSLLQLFNYESQTQEGISSLRHAHMWHVTISHFPMLFQEVRVAYKLKSV